MKCKRTAGVGRLTAVTLIVRGTPAGISISDVDITAGHFYSDTIDNIHTFTHATDHMTDFHQYWFQSRCSDCRS